ncbi:hypothetical protein I352_03599 [Cryptococcus deuterogattii MMRL2647]|nr:hypothetical protein I352_03599 [Cryptococcus deuterogattii MMRL2647]
MSELKRKQWEIFAQEQTKYKTQCKNERKPVVEGYDVRVGDTLRAIGVLEEWSRREGVFRQLMVSPSAGGSIDVQNAQPPSSPGWHPKSDSTVLTLDDSVSASVSVSDSRFPSASGSVLVLGNCPKLKLRHPTRLPSATLTRPTFRRYILHTVISHVEGALEILLTPEDEDGDGSAEGDDPEKGKGNGGDEEKKAKEKEREGVERLRKALGYYFPEYRELNKTLQRDSPRPRSQPRPCGGARRRRPPRTAKEIVGPLIPFTLTSLLADPTLSLLGGLVLEREARARVKMLKRQVLSGPDSHPHSHSTSSKTQSQSQSLQEEYTSRRLLHKQTSSFFTPSEKERALRGMITTALREMAEEGEIVQVRLETAFTPFLDARATHPNTRDTWGYLPLPPPLVFPLLFPLILSLQSTRVPQSHSQSLSRRAADLRHGRIAPPLHSSTPTITTNEITKSLTQWGKDGRWERVRSEVVQAGLHWAQERGWVVKKGEGWVFGEAAYDWV